MRVKKCSMLAATGVLIAGCNPQEPAEQAAAVQTSTGTGQECASLLSLALPTTTITTAETVPAGAFVPPSPPPFPIPGLDYSRLPSFCRVVGSIKPTPSSDIGFEVWLPDDWNGKFMGIGNGGAAGAIFHFAMAEPLQRGYAVANSDTGHRGPGGDMSFAAGQPEKLADFNFRAMHEMTVAGKAITAARYGGDIEQSYWNGCSTGGRQGLKEVQRYPDDYDGVIAGAPANNMAGLSAFSILVQRELTDPSGPLPFAKLPMIKEAAIAACDARDGVTDRVIGNPADCDFEPESLQCTAGAADTCLTPAEVEAARQIYRGVVNARSGEQVFPGTEPGGEPGWAAFGSPEFAIGTSHFRHTVANDPNWDPFTFDFDADIARLAEADAGAGAAMDPDISAFVGNGGKLLMYHGWTDGLISPRNSVSYYESVVATIGAGAAQDSVRLLMLPGVDHCQGGEGAFIVDYIGALENWVENGEAPDRLIASRPPGEGSFTRPACAFPNAPRYTGAGPAADAASWECVAP
jgi:feruloyl esterase